MKFLTKLGQIMLRVVNIGTEIMAGIPLIQPYLPAKVNTTIQSVEDRLKGIFSAVITTEQMAASLTPGLSGSQKLQIAKNFVIPIIQSVETIEGKKPKDEAAFEKACTDLTSAVADILNSFGD